VLAGSPVTSTADRDYNFACYLLINDGLDCHDNDNADPDHWWDAYDMDFGSALGDRYIWQGAIRRDFTTAVILVNEPGGYTLTLDLGDTFTMNGVVCIVKIINGNVFEERYPNYS
jgi:hypothetical protein